MVYSTDVKYKEFGGWSDDLNRTCATFYVENKNDGFSYMTLGDLCQEEEFFIKTFQDGNPLPLGGGRKSCYP